MKYTIFNKIKHKTTNKEYKTQNKNPEMEMENKN